MKAKLNVTFPESIITTSLAKFTTGTVKISLPIDVSSCAYSIDEGAEIALPITANYTASFPLREGTYSIGRISVRCIRKTDDPLTRTNDGPITINYRIEGTVDISNASPLATITATTVSLSALTTAAIDLTDTTVIGTTELEQRTFTSNLVKSIVSSNTENKQIILKAGSVFPGFSTSLASDLYVYSASTVVASSLAPPPTVLTKETLLLKQSYILLESSDTIQLKTYQNKTVTFSKYGDVFTITNDIETVTKNLGETYSYDGLYAKLGSVFATLSPPPIEFVLTALDGEFTLGSAATLRNLDISLNDTLKIDLHTSVSASVLQKTFFFRTDESITGDEAFVYYYVDKTQWDTSPTPPLTVLNPFNGTVVAVGDDKFLEGDNVGKDFLRYLAFKLFGTYLGADLFTNENTIVNDISRKCLKVSENICDLLFSIDLSGGRTNSNMHADPSSNYYMKDDLDISSNVCRAIFDQLVKHAPTRFKEIKTTYKYNPDIPDNGFYKMPILQGDYITFRLAINPDGEQSKYIQTKGENYVIEPRVYTVRMRVGT